MKATGIVRKVDELGRIVIPKELCRTHRIESGTPLEIYTDGEDIILRKYLPGCVFCGGLKNLRTFMDKNVCHQCAGKIRAVLENG